MRQVLAHCPSPVCPVKDVPDDRGEIGGRRYQMTTWEGHWTGELPRPRCGFCGGFLVRNAGDERTGRSTADRRNTWQFYTVAAATACHVRRLVSGSADDLTAVWEDWRPYITKLPHRFTTRTRARAGFWTFRLESGGRLCEVEFPQLAVEVSNT